MATQELENKIWKDYCDHLEPLLDVMVRHIALATLELGVDRGMELLGKAFDLTFSQVNNRIWAEIDRRLRSAGKPPERMQ